MWKGGGGRRLDRMKGRWKKMNKFVEGNGRVVEGNGRNC